MIRKLILHQNIIKRNLPEHSNDGLISLFESSERPTHFKGSLSMIFIPHFKFSSNKLYKKLILNLRLMFITYLPSERYHNIIFETS